MERETPVNRPLFGKIAAMIEEHPDRWNQASYVTGWWKASDLATRLGEEYWQYNPQYYSEEKLVLADVLLMPECGTSFCISGWAVVLDAIDKHRLLNHVETSAGAEVLGLNGDEQIALFHGGMNSTPQEAAEIMRRIESGEDILTVLDETGWSTDTWSTDTN